MHHRAKQPPISRPNLYLIGFMGVGKSAIGRSIAKQLHMDFIDSDHWIEAKAGMEINRIFAEQGEPAFRTMERDFIEAGHPAHNCIVSCGGGLPCQPGMAELLLEKGVVICLFARPETILQRALQSGKRPLLNVENPEARVRELLAQREPIYMRTGIGVSTEGRSIHEIVENVIRIYLREARLRPAPQK